MDELRKAVHGLDKVATEPIKGKYILQLYVAGTTPMSRRAIINVKKICKESLLDVYDLQIIDIFQQPLLAKAEQIIAVPTLIKKIPTPQRLFIGDMSDTKAILDSLNS